MQAVTQQVIKQHIAKYIEGKKPPYSFLQQYRHDIGATCYINITQLHLPEAFDQRLVFVSDRPNYHFLRVSQALKETGTQTVLLTRWGVPEAQLAFFDDIVLYDKFDELEQLAHCQHCQFYVQSWIGWSFLYAYIRTITELPIFCNTNDLASLLLIDNAYFDLVNLATQEAQADLAFELSMLQQAQLVTLPYELDALEKLDIDTARFNRNLMSFPSYPLAEFNSEQPRTLARAVKLLYAGMIPFDERPDLICYDAKMHKPAEKILQQGLSLTIYNNPQHTKALDEHAIKTKYRFFYELMRQYSNFHFRDGYMPWDLSEHVGDFHFGIILYMYPDEFAINPVHYEKFLPTKLYTYFEAGLPVIVVDKLQAGSQLVSKHQLGFVVKQHEIGQLAEIIEQHRPMYDTYVNNVKNYRQAFQMATMVQQLKI